MAGLSFGVMPLATAAEQITFAEAPIGSVPLGIGTALTGKGLPGIWTVVEDKTAEGGRAFEQRTPDPTDYCFPVVGGRRQEVKGANLRVEAGAWHTLSLRAQGSEFSISFDGQQLFTASDVTFGGEGRVAFWTKADSITRFDQLTVTPLK